MSKSLGNTIEPQDDHQGERRRHPPPLGRDGATTARRSASARRSSRASSRRTGRSATRCGTSRRTCTTSIRRPIACRSIGMRGGRPVRAGALRATAATPCSTAYEAYDYPTIFQAVNQFATVDLSAFYADVSKDRLYTFGAASPERRSAQTAMYIDRRRPDAAARADPVVHDRRAVAAPARARARSRCTWRSFPRTSDGLVDDGRSTAAGSG